jgi:anthranilate synthase component 1
VVGGERLVATASLACSARTLVRASGAEATTEVVTDGVVVETSPESAGLHQRLPKAPTSRRPGLPRAFAVGGLFRIRRGALHRKKLEHSCPPDTPGSDILLLQCEELAVIDNLSGKLYLITTPTRPCPRPTPTPKALGPEEQLILRHAPVVSHLRVSG